MKSLNTSARKMTKRARAEMQARIRDLTTSANVILVNCDDMCRTANRIGAQYGWDDERLPLMDADMDRFTAQARVLWAEVNTLKATLKAAETTGAVA